MTGKRVQIVDEVVATFGGQERDVCFGNYVLFVFKVLKLKLESRGEEKKDENRQYGNKLTLLATLNEVS